MRCVSTLAADQTRHGEKKEKQQWVAKEETGATDHLASSPVEETGLQPAACLDTRGRRGETLCKEGEAAVSSGRGN